jgi:hypothetical protein
MAKAYRLLCHYLYDYLVLVRVVLINAGVYKRGESLTMLDKAGKRRKIFVWKCSRKDVIDEAKAN